MKIEHAVGTTSSKAALAHRRLRLLNRLADLEAELALLDCLAPGPVESKRIASPGDLMPPLSIAELQALEDGAKKVPPHKLN